MKLFLSTLLLSCSLAASAQINLNSGLVAYYPFSGTFADASGNGNNGSGRNGVTFGTDQWGNPNEAALFDGTDDYITVPGSASITPGTRFSIALRFNTSSSNFQMIASKAEVTGNISPDNLQYAVGFNAGNALGTNALYWTTSHSGVCPYFTSSVSTWRISYGNQPTVNRWHCAVLTFENGIKKVYMDGSLISTAAITGTPLNNSVDSCVSGPLKFGVWWMSDPLWYKGLLDEVRVYNRALTALEADSLCNLKPEISTSVINRYAAITSNLPCSNFYDVDDASGFATGDTVLMIQMKGAVVDSSNSATFGQILALNGAGNYEYNVVQSVSGNRITLRNRQLRRYDIPAGKVQLVRVPSFANHTISQQQSCMPWNGNKGGVYAIRASGTLTLNAGINVDSQGFRGGQPLLLRPHGCNKTDYYYPSTTNEGAQKGEGIATIDVAKGYGRGRLANGGGGGNDHNAGGGGGGSYGGGGAGGDQHYIGSCATDPGIGGLGGSLNSGSFAGRMFLGGGGGCGHGNDGAEKAGGHGGGIIIIDAPAIVGNGQLLSANGGNAPQCTGPGAANGPCQNDAGGGGGGGGLIYLNATMITGGLRANAAGGKGSDVYLMTGIPAMGPGGGGGGGAVAAISTNTLTRNINGGNSGTVPQLATSHNALPGASGATLSGAPIPMTTTPFVPGTTKPSFRDSVTGCLSRQLISTSTPAPTRLEWSIPGVGTSDNDSAVFNFPQAGTYELVVWATDASGCRDSIRRSLVILQPLGGLYDSSFCATQPIVLNARAGSAYVWAPGSGLSGTDTRMVSLTDVEGSRAETRTYYVGVTVENRCIVTDTYRVKIAPAPIAAFDYQPDPPRPNTPISFINRSGNALAYQWEFGDGTSSTEANPQHTYTATEVFKVCLLATGAQGCQDSICREIAADTRKLLGVPTGFSPNGDGNNDVVLVKGGPFSSLSFAIFNRWGQRVFYTNDQMSGWDGSFRGSPQPIDVYSYVITVSYPDGSTETRKGNITLLR